MSQIDSGRQTRARIGLPILIITVGLGWFLTVKQIGEEINWVWTLGLGVTGLLILLPGVNKFSIVVGPLLLVASVFSILRQTNRIRFESELPLLVVSLGVLLLIAQHRSIAPPAWMVEGTRNSPPTDDH